MGSITEKLQTLDGLIDQLIANQGSIGDSNDDGFYDTPNDGNTYLFVDIPRDNYTTKLYLATGGNYKISWGDNTEDDSGRGYDYDAYATPYTHYYEKRGKYVIKVEAEKLKILTDFNDCDESYSNYELSNTSSIFYDPVNYYIYDDSIGCLIQYTNILEKIVIGNTVREINDYALANCKNLKSVIIYPYTYLNFGENVFRNCTALKECIIKSNNANNTAFSLIPKNTFYNCNSLRYFNFPVNVAEIANGAFYNCMSLEEVTFNSVEPPQCHYSNWETVEVYDEYLGEYTQKDVYIPSSFDGFKTLYPVAVYIPNVQNKSKYNNFVNTFLGYTWANVIIKMI